MKKTVFTKYGKKNLVGKPRHLKARIPKGNNYLGVKKSLRERNLYTVCEEAKCPNLGECWDAKTATMMILGDKVYVRKTPENPIQETKHTVKDGRIEISQNMYSQQSYTQVNLSGLLQIK